MIKEIGHFLLHLRLHYQLFILSGGFLLGGLMADQMSTAQFWLQFLNVHILLFGGATAFNSYWDKDEGPIGGLKNPPKMTDWMRIASLVMMAIGWVWSALFGVLYFVIYGVSIMFFWLYSTPLARWKSHPYLSLIAIGVSTGFNSVLLGTIAAGGSVNTSVIISAFGASMILLSLYPVSQIYQMEQDKRRGDRTFAVEYGVDGVKFFFVISYLFGMIFFSAGLLQVYPYPAVIFFILGLISGVILLRLLLKLKGMESEYSSVMKLKFLASLSFVIFLMILNAVRYEWIGETVLINYF
ncbi:UbiA family prenyltransferase [Rhodohalobacter sp.]|uniref:UbiA family prenyltransferase n=1 Tax=Rhodohalobacter sp. TaxID=1974210 RepID=UPI002ACE256E|nr:UbiA family prenyltransferase [Rhodohalobacter sp.]MDZ7756549.1 UbiA family prenyltransferase [Rhodohalobacter sp.]